MVEQGEIPPGKVLMIESLDRLSRETVLKALRQFMALVEAGIIIATLADKQIYSRETIGNDWTKLIFSLTIMARAHEESAMKAQRLAAAWEKKRRDAPTKPMTARCPEWSKLVDGKFELIPDRVAIIRRIFEECVSGLGKRQIATRLNEEGIPAFRGENGWHGSSVQKILSNEGVLGVFQPHRRANGKRIPDGEPIPNYYPPIIDEVLFWRVRASVESRSKGAAGRKGKGYANLLQGLGMCECGASLVYVDKGKSPKGGQYLVCSRAKRGLCSNRTHYPYRPLEDEILRLVPLINLDAILPRRQTHKEDDLISDLEAELARKTQRLNSLLDLEDIDAAKDRIRKLNLEIQNLKIRLTEIQENS